MDHNLRAVEDHEVAKDKHTQTWNEAYAKAYESIPADFGGSMLRDAVDSLMLDELLDDIIISAYSRNDREAAATALFLMLDNWRKRQAEYIADKEAGE